MSNPDQSPSADERAAFIRWLCESFPAAWTEKSAAHAWDNNEAAVSAWHSAREPLIDAIAELKSRVAPTEAAAMAATVPDIVFTDEMDCTHHWSHAAATEFMRKFFNEWPGGMSEVESALRTAKQAPVAGQPANEDQKYWFRKGFEWAEKMGQPAEPSPADLQQEVERLRALSVTNIMLDITPGMDGMGHEVFAKSVADVERKLSHMGELLEDFELGIRKPQGVVLVTQEFIRGFGDLAHNYQLEAVPPDYYHGTEGDAFRAAYKRCGADLKKLRDLLAAPKGDSNG